MTGPEVGVFIANQQNNERLINKNNQSSIVFGYDTLKL